MIRGGFRRVSDIGLVQQQLLAALSDAAVIFSSRKPFLRFANQAFFALFGLDPEDSASFTFRAFKPLLHPDDYRPLTRLLYPCPKREPARTRFDFSLPRWDGLRHIEAVNSILSDDAERLTLTVFRDETEKRLKDRLAAEIYDNLSEGLFVWRLDDPDHDHALVLEAANPTGLALMGLSRDELVGRRIDEAFPLLREQGLPGVFREAALTGMRRSFQIRYADARLPTAVWSVNVFPLSGLRVGVSFSDVTTQTLDAERLAQSESELLFTQRLAGLGAWRIDVETGEGELSPEAQAIYRVPTDNGRITMTGFLESVHPDDRALVERTWIDSLKEKRELEIVYRLFTTAGALLWVRAFGRKRVDPRTGREVVTGAVQDITHLKKAEEALAASEAKLRFAQRLARLGTWEFDPMTGVGLLSPEAQAIYRLDAPGGRMDMNAFAAALHPDDRDRVQNAWIDTLSGDDEHEVLYRLRTQDGDLIWLRAFGRRHVDKTTGRTLIFGAAQDITHLKKAEEALAASEAKLRFAQRLARLGTWEFDVEAGVGRLSPEAQAVYRLDAPGGEITNELFAAALHPEDREWVLAVWKRGWENDGEIEAVYRLYTKDGELIWIHAFGRGQIDAHTGRRLVFGVSQDVTVFKTVEEELRKSQAALTLSQDMAGLGSWETDIGAGVVRFSPEAARIHLVEPDAPPISLDAFMLRVHPDDWNTIKRTWEATLRGTPPKEVVFRFRKPDGEYIWLRAFGKFGDGGRIIGVTQDVTSIKAAEESLRKSEARLRQAQRVAGLGLWELVPHDSSYAVSDEVLDILGIDRGRLADDYLVMSEMALPEDREALLRTIQSQIATGESAEYLIRIQRPNGELRWVRSFSEVERDAQGRSVRLIGALQDVTPMKEAEEAVKKSEARLRQAQRAAGLGLWELDTKTFAATLSDKAISIMGFSTPPPSGGFHDMLGVVHPEDRGDVLARIERQLATAENAEYLARVLHPSGELRWVRSFSEVELDAQGLPIRLVGALQEVTAMKEAEEALKKSEARLLRAQKAAGLGLWEYDAEEGFGFWSAEMYSLFGLMPSQEPVARERFLGAMHEADRDRIAAEMQRQAELGGTWEYLFRILRNGETRWMRSFSETEFDASGKVRGFVGAMQDITVLKVVEEALHESEQRLTHAKRLAGLGNWEYDLDADAGSASSEYYAVFGETPDSYPINAENFLNRVHPDDRRQAAQGLAGFQSVSGPASFDMRIIRPNGEVRHVRHIVEAAPKELGRPGLMYGATYDVTDFVLAQEALKESESRFRAIFDSVLDNIVVWDRDYRYVYANKAALDYVGVGPDKVVGQTIREGLGHIPDFMHLWMSRVDHAFAIQTPFRVEDAAPVGDRFAYSESVLSPIRNAQGEMIAVGLVYRDVTERKLSEAQKLELETTRIELAKQTELAELKSRFMSMVAHEVRTPLTSAFFALDFLIDREQTLTLDLRSKYLRIARQAAEEMKRLLDEVLILARLEAGGVVVSPVLFTPESWFRELVARFGAQSDDRRIKTVFNGPVAAPFVSDPKLIEHIAINLLSNAVKYSPGAPSIEARLSVVGAELVLEVEDFGIGVPKADQAGIFERFHRASNVGAIRGVGLGLSIAGFLTDKLSGRIGFTSQENVGSVFTVRLPRLTLPTQTGQRAAGRIQRD